MRIPGYCRRHSQKTPHPHASILLNIGGGHNNGWIFTAELKRNRREMVGSSDGNLTTNFRRADERDMPDIGRLGQSLRLVRVAAHELEKEDI